ncbi:general substrate transporter [Tilletiaria anomala UBC 951]|uniref:General substrate transporter n=1 Tax=Tilletiaria anomala (strain ATCC 24038 / CBS 436.72 / UBC 951) TaxID=1037660 RepID=A0A066V975_TILAU|nr:general substrate transporter [Tilletiaria anomala UBC 951]KDN38031.1 general substrate transporter [Tilletiaria anomala UBC 951]
MANSPAVADRGRGTTPVRLTAFFYWMVIFIILSAFQYGWGIAELNVLQDALTCKEDNLTHESTSKGTPGNDCIGLTETQFGYVTALFTVGGFLSSLSLSTIAQRLQFGQRISIFLAALFNTTGGAIISMSAGFVSAGVGRFVMGLGAGIAVVCVPIYLSDISPPALKGSVGVLNQLGIVLGIFAAQVTGSLLTSPGHSISWRWTPGISAVISAAQLVCGMLFALESPRWEEEKNGDAGKQRAQRICAKLWSSTGAAAQSRHSSANEETEALLQDRSHFQSPHMPSTHETSFADLLKDSEIRPGMVLIAFTQLGQQLSGVNAVLYYSTGILGSLLKDDNGARASARWMGVGITVVNAVMTFPPIFLIPEHRFGRKNLLLLSSGTMVLSSLVLGLSLQLGWSDILSAACLLLFVMGFSVGLGPVPFLILPELVPARAMSHASSVGLALNWVANIVLASSFLPLRYFFASIDGGRGGSIFWVFTVVNTLTFFVVLKKYRYSGDEMRRLTSAGDGTAPAELN